MSRSLSFLLGLLVLLVAPQLSFAQSEKLEEAAQALEESAAFLTDEKVHDELAEYDVKDATFAEILKLTLLEIEELEQRLRSAKPAQTNDFFLVYEQFLLELQEAEDYIVALQERLSDVRQKASLEDLQGLANELKDWRAKRYDPTNQRLLEYLISLRFEKLLLTAESREKKIRRDLERFADDFGPLGLLELEEFFARAEAELLAAAELRDVLRSDFLSLFALGGSDLELEPLAQSSGALSSSGTQADAATSKASASLAFAGAESEGLFADRLNLGLEHIKAAYQEGFLKMSVLAKGLLLAR